MIHRITEGFRAATRRRLIVDFTSMELGLDMLDIVADLEWRGSQGPESSAGVRDAS